MDAALADWVAACPLRVDDTIRQVFEAIDACQASRSEKSFLRKLALQRRGEGDVSADASESALCYHERLLLAAAKAIGSSSRLGPGDVQAALKAKGHQLLAKLVEKENRARRAAAHPIDPSLIDQVVKALLGSDDEAAAESTQRQASTDGRDSDANCVPVDTGSSLNPNASPWWPRPPGTWIDTAADHTNSGQVLDRLIAALAPPAPGGMGGGSGGGIGGDIAGGIGGGEGGGIGGGSGCGISGAATASRDVDAGAPGNSEGIAASAFAPGASRVARATGLAFSVELSVSCSVLPLVSINRAIGNRNRKRNRNPSSDADEAGTIGRAVDIGPLAPSASSDGPDLSNTRCCQTTVSYAEDIETELLISEFFLSAAASRAFSDQSSESSGCIGGGMGGVGFMGGGCGGAIGVGMGGGIGGGRGGGMGGGMFGGMGGGNCGGICGIGGMGGMGSGCGDHNQHQLQQPLHLNQFQPEQTQERGQQHGQPSDDSQQHQPPQQPTQSRPDNIQVLGHQHGQPAGHQQDQPSDNCQHQQLPQQLNHIHPDHTHEHGQYHEQPSADSQQLHDSIQLHQAHAHQPHGSLQFRPTHGDQLDDSSHLPTHGQQLHESMQLPTRAHQLQESMQLQQTHGQQFQRSLQFLPTHGDQLPDGDQLHDSRQPPTHGQQLHEVIHLPTRAQQLQEYMQLPTRAQQLHEYMQLPTRAQQLQEPIQLHQTHAHQLQRSLQLLPTHGEQFYDSRHLPSHGLQLHESIQPHGSLQFLPTHGERDQPPGNCQHQQPPQQQDLGQHHDQPSEDSQQHQPPQQLLQSKPDHIQDLTDPMHELDCQHQHQPPQQLIHSQPDQIQELGQELGYQQGQAPENGQHQQLPQQPIHSHPDHSQLGQQHDDPPDDSQHHQPPLFGRSGKWRKVETAARDGPTQARPVFHLRPSQAHTASHSTGTGRCSIHGSQRSIDNLGDDGTGVIRCIEGRECRDRSGTTQLDCLFWKRGTCNKGDSCLYAHNASAQEQSWAGAKWATAHSKDSFGVCSQHGSGRSLECLADDGTGNLRCIKGRECRVKSQAKCSFWHQGKCIKGASGDFAHNGNGKDPKQTGTASVGSKPAHRAHSWTPKLFLGR